MTEAVQRAAAMADGPLESLVQLALDLRWSWHHTSDELWRRLEPELWDLTQNAWVILQTVSQQKLKATLEQPAMMQLLQELIAERRSAIESPGWFRQTHADSPLTCVAYFSMEFMLSEALPIYSGGLGNVAGDQLKAASDLDIPVVGIGLLYQQGYFRQQIDAEGLQQALYPFNDPGQLPITPVRDAAGEWLRIPVVLPGFKLWIRVWQAVVGRTRLYLLDTNDPANLPSYRGITSELYPSGAEARLRQEMVLGIAGWRLLRSLGLHAEVCHMNEGHAAFAVLERAHGWMLDHKQPFDIALAVTRAGNLFTTHTPVEAGFDRFAPHLIEQYFTLYAEQALGIPLKYLLALGRQNPEDSSEPFNMAYLAIRGSCAINGVSKLHGQVSRRIFQPLFPRWPQLEVPVTAITNGVHTPSWDSAASDALWTRSCGKGRWLGSLKTLEESLRCVSDEEFWELRAVSRRELVEYTRVRLARELAARGEHPQQVAVAGQVFDSNTLTIGFARRFTAYKRPNLLLHDPERLIRILTNRDFPVQLVLAGKAHPQDFVGQQLIQQWVRFVHRPEVRPHAVFLSDHDMHLTEHLVQGVDLWLNTPRRPWEACGTSGMKVLVNGGLNISVLDGWWAEAFSPEIGWAIGDGQEHDGARDAQDANQLYQLLEERVIPEFYHRNSQGIPARWVARMKESMARLTSAFSSNRAVREYTEQHYLPAATAYLKRARSETLGAELLEWRQHLDRHWHTIRFGTLTVLQEKERFLFSVQLYLNSLPANSIQMEIFADSPTGGHPLIEVMQRGPELVGSQNAYLYTGSVPADRPSQDFTVRVVPFHPEASVPIEASHILWQR
ncbi:MAG: glycosyltransferase family 1 protein [Acidobacteria bacterium]|nr:glycosyltransferase family 1 protein [Acidobacteriota bacterium]MBW4044604.1 glycosyltransferase family 1 protein [Acidobacteriota bacterium]